MLSLNRACKSNKNREVSVAERSKAPDSSLKYKLTNNVCSGQ